METPALLTHVSKPPQRPAAVSAMRLTSSSRPTSATTYTASPPRELISSTRRRSESSARAATTSFAPRSAALRAVTSPMPLDAPVMTTTCSPNFLSLTSIVNLPRPMPRVLNPLSTDVSAAAASRASASTPVQKAAVLDHQAAILHDLDAGARELFRRRVVAYAGLKPDRARALGEYVFEVRRDILRAPE